MRARPVLYPFLFAVYPVLYFYARNAREVPLGELWLPLLLVLGATGALWGLLWLGFRDVHRAGLVALLAVILIATVETAPGRVQAALDALGDAWDGRNWVVPRTAVVVVELGMAFGLAWLAWRWVRRPRAWTQALNLFAAILVASPVALAVQARSTLPPVTAKTRPPLAALHDAGRHPDIYYIILDGFARGDVLKQTFGYDLEPFLQRLERRGFYVARESRSNYGQTPLSLASSLNGDYLEPPPGDPTQAPLPTPDVFQKNAVVASLRPLGYSFVTFSSGFDFTEYPEADVYLAPRRHIGAFQRALLDATPFRRLLPSAAERDSYTMARERVSYLFRTLPEVAKRPGPKFTFAHVLSPHPPFVFGEHGEDVSPRHVPYSLSDGPPHREHYHISDEEFIAAYRRQAAFLVTQVERAIDGILVNSAEPPIVVLQSDHGSGLRLHTEDHALSDHRERMSIVNAFYLPGGKRTGLSQTLTPVNAFRVVFNNEFGAELPLLPERSYYSAWSTPFVFIDVTERVRRPISVARAAGAARGISAPGGS